MTRVSTANNGFFKIPCHVTWLSPKLLSHAQGVIFDPANWLPEPAQIEKWTEFIWINFSFDLPSLATQSVIKRKRFRDFSFGTVIPSERTLSGGHTDSNSMIRYNSFWKVNVSALILCKVNPTIKSFISTFHKYKIKIFTLSILRKFEILLASTHQKLKRSLLQGRYCRGHIH